MPSFLVLQKDNTVCLEILVELRETCWIVKQFHPILSAKFGRYIWQSKVEQRTKNNFNDREKNAGRRGEEESE